MMNRDVWKSITVLVSIKEIQRIPKYASKHDIYYISNRIVILYVIISLHHCLKI